MKGLRLGQVPSRCEDAGADTRILAGGAVSTAERSRVGIRSVGVAVEG